MKKVLSIIVLLLLIIGVGVGSFYLGKELNKNEIVTLKSKLNNTNNITKCECEEKECSSDKTTDIIYRFEDNYVLSDEDKEQIKIEMEQNPSWNSNYTLDKESIKITNIDWLDNKNDFPNRYFIGLLAETNQQSSEGIGMIIAYKVHNKFKVYTFGTAFVDDTIKDLKEKSKLFDIINE